MARPVHLPHDRGGRRLSLPTGRGTALNDEDTSLPNSDSSPRARRPGPDPFIAISVGQEALSADRSAFVCYPPIRQPSSRNTKLWTPSRRRQVAPHPPLECFLGANRQRAAIVVGLRQSSSLGLGARAGTSRICCVELYEKATLTHSFFSIGFVSVCRAAPTVNFLVNEVFNSLPDLVSISKGNKPGERRL